MAARFEYRFEWDPIKAARNAKDHGVTFEQAATVFRDARLLSQIDEELWRGRRALAQPRAGQVRSAFGRVPYIPSCNRSERDHPDLLGAESDST